MIGEKAAIMETVKFTQMKDGDREDYAFLNAHETDYAAGTADRWPCAGRLLISRCGSRW